MIKKYNGRKLQGIKALVVTNEQERINDWRMIRKTISRLIAIGGFATYSCRYQQIKETIERVKPVVCIIANAQVAKEIRTLAPECKIIIADFLCPVYMERRAIMWELEIKLSELKVPKEELADSKKAYNFISPFQEG